MKKFLLRNPIYWFILIAIGVVVAFVSAHRALSGSSDFDVYYYAAKSVRFGEALYTLNRHGISESGSPFVYPPFFAFLMVPFTIFPIGFAAALWNIFNLGLFAGCIQLTLSLISEKFEITQLKDRSQLLWVLLLITLMVLWFSDNIAMAQVNVLVLFFILLSFHLRSKKKQNMAAGFSLGLSVAIKLIPFLFLPYFLIKRDWKFIIGFLFALIPALVVPSAAVGVAKSVEYHKAWVEETLKDHTQPKTLGFYASQLSPSHQNLQAVLFRLVIDWEFRETTGGPNGKRYHFRTPLRLKEEQAVRLAWSVSVGLLALLLLALFASKNQHLLIEGISAIFCGMVLFAPKVRSHFFIFLLVPLLFILFKIVTSSERQGSSKIEKGVLSVSAVLYFLQGIKYMKFLGAGCWSVLVLFVYFLIQLLRRERVHA